MDNNINAGDDPQQAIFGRLPMLNNNTDNGAHSRATRLDSHHGRTASYGTSLLDTLNEEKQMQHQHQHQRHLTLASPSPFTMAAASSGPPPSTLPTNASGMLGAHTHLGALTSSALRSSYSTNSLRSAFARRSSPSPLAPMLDEGVWGPSGLSNELDLLPTPTIDSPQHYHQQQQQQQQQQEHGLAYALNGLSIDGSRIRSYSFNSPPDATSTGETPDDASADIDVLHAAAKTQNPSVAFRKMMARTHARSKTLANPFIGAADMAEPPGINIGIGGESNSGTTDIAAAVAASSGWQPQALATNSGRTSSSAVHSRQPSMSFHTRQHSAEFDYAMMHGGDGVPTRSLWVGNVDPGLSSQDLISIFGKYGRVESLRLLPDKECAFVNFLRVDDAIRAKEDMHAGARIGSNTVRVGYGKGEAYATGDAQAMQPTRALWIGNIAPASTTETLSAAFEPFGTIDSVRVLNHKNCGFVNFVRMEDAVRAKQAMNGKHIEGSVVRIGYAKVPAAKNEISLKMRNPVPSAAPLTMSGQIAEADAITGTTQRGLGNDMALEPGVSLAVDENLVAYPYATQLPGLPPPTVYICTGDSESPPPASQPDVPVMQQTRLREIRKQLESTGSPLPKEEFDAIVAELMPHAVDLCTDYVGNVLVQRIAERGSAAQRLQLIQTVGPHMAAIGVHKNGTWAVQKIIDTADNVEQFSAIAESIRRFTPQLLVDQLGNYVVQCCLRFGDPTNQFIYDAIHARCLEISQGRFGARAIRTCLESQYATRLQQKLVAVALVTNAVPLATNANGHLLVNWLQDSSQFTGRFRVLAHQLAPHLRYLATHKLGASTISKLAEQTMEPDARDLVLNTLFFNPDPSVLDDVLLDQAQGVHIVLRILLGSSIGDTEKARIAERLRYLCRPGSTSPPPLPSSSSSGGGGGGSCSSVSSPPAQRLSDVVGSILARQQQQQQQQSVAPAATAMSFPAPQLPPAGFVGGMVGNNQQQQQQASLLAAIYRQQQNLQGFYNNNTNHTSTS
ncbi:hypothetical protein GGI23_000739 [Coemansia sp. RSA 2559]|nr:hypothetical protein GGI23_000739 [Coemansia sp. RSA 2559]KAJ2868854.1 hypothetical protein GGI22_000607 [Coemansia erecta]